MSARPVKWSWKDEAEALDSEFRSALFVTRYGWSVEEAVSTPVGKKGWKRSVACTFRCDPQNIDSIPVAQPTSRDETHAGTL